MGFLWAMKQSPGQREGLRLVKNNVEEPILVTMSVHQGHLNTAELPTNEALSSAQIERWYMAKNVERILIRSGRIRGTLFKPKGDGQYLGVIDMFGGAGGLMEHRSAILASRGFAVLSLAFIGYEDLPNSVEDFSYFEEAIDYLIGLNCTVGKKVGLLGTSLGGCYALCATTLFPQKIYASVIIGGYHFLTTMLDDLDRNYLAYRDKKLAKLPENPDLLEKVMNANERVFIKYFPPMSSIPKECIFELEKIRCPIMFIVSEDDLNLPAKSCAEHALRRLPKEYDHQLISYPGACHLIEVPYMPHCFESFMKLLYKIVAWGGNTVDHARAQEDSWTRLREFLKNHSNFEGNSQGAVVEEMAPFTERTSKL